MSKLEIIPIKKVPGMKVAHEGQLMYFDDNCTVNPIKTLDAPAAVAEFFDGELNVNLGEFDTEYSGEICRSFGNDDDNWCVDISWWSGDGSLEYDSSYDEDKFPDGFIDSDSNRKIINDCIETFNQVITYLEKMTNEGQDINNIIEGLIAVFKKSNCCVNYCYTGEGTYYIDENGETATII